VFVTALFGMCISYASLTTNIRLRFDGRSTSVRLMTYLHVYIDLGRSAAAEGR